MSINGSVTWEFKNIYSINLFVFEKNVCRNARKINNAIYRYS